MFPCLCEVCRHHLWQLVSSLGRPLVVVALFLFGAPTTFDRCGVTHLQPPWCRRDAVKDALAEITLLGCKQTVFHCKMLSLCSQAQSWSPFCHVSGEHFLHSDGFAKMQLQKVGGRTMMGGVESFQFVHGALAQWQKKCLLVIGHQKSAQLQKQNVPTAHRTTVNFCMHSLFKEPRNKQVLQNCEGKKLAVWFASVRHCNVNRSASKFESRRRKAGMQICSASSNAAQECRWQQQQQQQQWHLRHGSSRCSSFVGAATACCNSLFFNFMQWGLVVNFATQCCAMEAHCNFDSWHRKSLSLSQFQQQHCCMQ